MIFALFIETLAGRTGVSVSIKRTSYSQNRKVFRSEIVRSRRARLAPLREREIPFQTFPLAAHKLSRTSSFMRSASASSVPASQRQSKRFNSCIAIVCLAAPLWLSALRRELPPSPPVHTRPTSPSLMSPMIRPANFIRSSMLPLPSTGKRKRAITSPSSNRTGTLTRLM